MTRSEEGAVIKEWLRFSTDKVETQQTYSDFFFDIIRTDAGLRHLNAFEVLDVVVNHVPHEPQPAYVS